MSSEKSQMQDSIRPGPQDMGVSASEEGSGAGTVSLRVHALAAGGRGVARHEGQVWLLDGALPGDLVRALPLRRRRRHVEGVAVEIVEASTERRTSPCRLQGECGGCPWMPLGEDSQRAWKVRLLRDALARIGRIEVPEPEPVRCPTAPLGYRNRVEFAARGGRGRPTLVGLHAATGRTLVDVDRCPLQGDPANAVLASVREFLSDERVKRGPSFHLRLTIRRADLDDRILVTLREEGPSRFVWGDSLGRFLAGRHPTFVGLVRLHSARGRRGGTRTQVLLGRSRLEEQIHGFRIELPAASFTQVSAAGAAELVKLVGQLAAPVDGRGALDLYGGIGLYGMELAARGADPVLVCDADGEAIAAGREAAAAAGLDSVRHFHADAASWLASPGARAIDIVVANPPRSGMEPAVVQAIRELAPGRLVIVSCDPPTLARDLGRLVGDGPYRVDRLVPVDLFPQTAHLETVVSLTA